MLFFNLIQFGKIIAISNKYYIILLVTTLSNIIIIHHSQKMFEEPSKQRTKRLKTERQYINRKRQKTQHRTSINRHELERMNQICIHCGAKFWIDEKDQNSSRVSPSFAVCCAGGKVSLPPLLKPPSYLMDLYTSSNADAVSFRKNIRGYNNLLACTSFGANISDEFRGQG